MINKNKRLKELLIGFEEIIKRIKPKTIREKLDLYQSAVGGTFMSMGHSTLSYEDAIILSDEVARLGNKKDKLWAMQCKADAYYKLKDYRNALGLFLRINRLYEEKKYDHPEYYMVAKIYLIQNKYQIAYDYYTKAIGWHVEYTLYLDRAKSLMGLNRYEEAKADLHKALELLKSWDISVQKMEGEEINALLHQINQAQHPKENNQTKKTGLKKLIDFGKRLIGK